MRLLPAGTNQPAIRCSKILVGMKNRTEKYDFTVIVPVFNEIGNMRRLEETFSSWLGESPCSACILFVDDGSTDGSREAIDDICRRNEDMFFISFGKNRGLSSAIKAGMDHVCSPLLGYIDADLQTSPSDFNLLLQFAGEYQLVNGIRVNRKDSAFKHLQSKIANGFRRMMTGDDATDTGCPLKVMHTSTAKRIPMFKGMHRFFPALVMLQEGARYKEVPVRHFPRVAGKSKFSIWNRLAGPFADCFAYRWMRKRAINYSVSDKNI